MERISVWTFQKSKQPPIIYRAGPTVSLLNVHLGNSGIVPDHVQAAVPK